MITRKTTVPDCESSRVPLPHGHGSESLTVLACVTAAVIFPVLLAAQAPAPRHNAILFIADGLRAASVTPESAPAMSALKAKGVDFANSHALYPTVTTANASAIATGHYLGDTGDFGNTLWFGFPIWAHGGAPVTFLENDAVLGELSQHYGGNYLNEESLVAAARRAGFATAVIGKAGPVLIQDVTSKRDGSETIFIDDTFGRDGGIPVPPALLAGLRAALLPVQTPDPTVPDVQQEVYLTQVAAKVVLPRLAASGSPFLLVFWSRDPDYSQHNAVDSVGQLEPGINGPTPRAGIRNADERLAALVDAVRALHLEDTTDIFVTADHGFGTIAKGTVTSGTSAAARCANPDQPPVALPQGFLAIDISKGLGLPLFDPDAALRPVTCASGETPSSGNGLIGADPAKPNVVVAANGGSDLIYVEDKSVLGDVVKILLAEDYVSGIFVKDSLGEFAGTLPMSRINLIGSAVTPAPDIVVNFRSYSSFSAGCANPRLCTQITADTNLREGQGQHGGFSRAETNNFMAAAGPDFKKSFVDDAPVSNADIAHTLARILGIELKSKGKLSGRVLTESLKDGGAVEWKRETIESKPSENGRTTILNLQRVGPTLYFDAAGFAARTVGLETP
jgi:arylsulfatase A-like enzyme